MSGILPENLARYARQVPRSPKSPPAGIPPAGKTPPGPRRSAGRRSGSPNTRAEIVTEARRQFAANGYDNTSLAAIARAVEVDATLITHFFGGKQALFAATLDAVRPAFAQVGHALASGRDDLGRRLTRAYLDAWESPSMRPDLLSMLRSASTSDLARTVVVTTIEEMPLRVAHESLSPAVVARLPLAMSMLVGVGFARYVLEAPAVRDATLEELVTRLGPAVEGVLGDE